MLQDDLAKEVADIFGPQWDVQPAYTVPETEDLRLNSNHAKAFAAVTVVYADIDGSTSMVDGKPWWFAAEVYKAYLRCASQILRSEGGTIEAYDGDRVMAIFVGIGSSNAAARAALKINTAVQHIINPAIRNRYPEETFVLKHVIGIDVSPMRTARIGIHADNDLVWVGRAANYAAKLCTFSGGPLWITQSVLETLLPDTRIRIDGLGNVWAPAVGLSLGTLQVYYSSCVWNRLD